MQMDNRYALSPDMWQFIAHSQTFTAASNALDARRAAFLRLCRHYTPAVEGIEMRDTTVGAVKVRIYHPGLDAPAGGWPTVLYLHGGGWNMGNLDTHDWFAFALLQRLPVAVLAVEYRLAPEAPYPAALEDAEQVYDALATGQFDPQLSRTRLAGSGDSAGGNLAAALCLALRDAGGPQPLAQALLCPVVTASQDWPSMRECADAPLLTATGLAASVAGYLPNVADHEHARAMPLAAARFDGLPRTFVAVAQNDPLLDQGRAYASAVRAAGGDVTEYVGAGLVHGCLRAPHIAEVDALYRALCDFLRDV